VRTIEHTRRAPSTAPEKEGRLTFRRGFVPPGRIAAGWVLGAIGTPALALLLTNLRQHVELSGVLLLFLLLVVAVAVVGGIWPALTTSLGSFLIANYYFTQPFYTLTIRETHNILALVVFVIVAAVVSTLVGMAARHESEATEATAVNELRAALLAAVSHDLRTPLSSIKASVTSLMQPDVEWAPRDAKAFLQTINDESDRLNRLVGSLLDMSRLQTGGLNLVMDEVGIDEVVAAALAEVGETASAVTVNVPESLPRVWVDLALLERSVANVVRNAIAHVPDNAAVRLDAKQVDEHIELRVVDGGPGIPSDLRARAFLPFERLDDAGHGVGLGLPVARGFVEAMGGTLQISETPGGGLTVTITLTAVHA
jgi:two-component system sensor histidine kinase KdpD